MSIVHISEVIPESNIVVFSPHFDDSMFMLGGYILELREKNLLNTKSFHINLLFSRSNYTVGAGSENYSSDLDRIKLATGKRLLEDTDCLNELLGRFNYHYEIIGETECLMRGKSLADSDMEFPHGMYEDFNNEDEEVFERMKQRVREWAMHKDTALVFPIAFKEHVDHFITREAGAFVAKELGDKAEAKFYFQEDKPYGGIADEKEIARIDSFIKENNLKSRVYKHHPEELIGLAFKHYISQVEEVYKIGIRQRSNYLKEHFEANHACDQIFTL